MEGQSASSRPSGPKIWLLELPVFIVGKSPSDRYTTLREATQGFVFVKSETLLSPVKELETNATRNIIVLKPFATAVSDDRSNEFPTEFFAVTVEWRDPGNTRQCSGPWLSPQSV
ncbi:hypothetical protein CEXT_454551 [Caerostris extrusa]|uniref:Uncharacterized protein n=1 Tax=Caerostris extrusa TaxID=172846 RepID=A0AAV4M4H6_CAEEX|nr:hypothetical protein CEXT_454551 [Caerostris extrusa]